MSSVDIRTGTEGPRHDPYGYEELTVTSERCGTVTLHEGLGCWLRVNGACANEGDHDRCVALFEHVCGITAKAARRAYERLRNRCQNCGCTDQRALSGYPGETLYLCVRCDAVVHVDFNEAAIR